MNGRAVAHMYLFVFSACGSLAMAVQTTSVILFKAVCVLAVGEKLWVQALSSKLFVGRSHELYEHLHACL